MSQTLRSCLAGLDVKTIVMGTCLSTTMLVGAVTPSYADPVSPEGIWYTKDEESIIKFQPCKNSFCGTIVWLKEPMEADGTPKLDVKNPDATKKTKPMIGVEIFSGLTAVDDHWKGKAYNSDDGKIYDITFTVKTNKEPNDQADVRGCILGFLCRTETFARAADVPGGDPTVVGTPVAVAKGAKAHAPTKKDTAKK